MKEEREREGLVEGEREWKIRKWNELLHSRPPLAHLDGYFPLLKEKREERGKKDVSNAISRREDDVCEEDSCCFPRGCALLVASHSHKERQSLLLGR